MSDSAAVLMIVAGLAVMVALIAVAPVIGVVWWPLLLLWEYTRPRSHRASRRKAAEARYARTQQLIRLHLTAHNLPDTPVNRERVLQALCRPAKAGRGQ